MKKFLQGRSISFWVVVLFVFLLAAHFIGVMFWDRSYSNLIQSIGWPGSIFLGVMDFFGLLVVAILPFLWFLIPLFLIVWFVVQRSNRRVTRKEKSFDIFHLILWIIFVIGTISTTVVLLFFASLLSPW